MLNTQLSSPLFLEQSGTLVIPKNTKLYQKLAVSSPLYIYANKYILWLTSAKHNNVQGKLLTEYMIDYTKDSLTIKLGSFLPGLLEKTPEGALKYLTSETELHFLFNKFAQFDFVRMDSDGHFHNLYNDNISKEYRLTFEPRMYNSQVLLPALEKESLSDNSYSSSETLTAEGLQTLNNQLPHPLEEDECLYVRPVRQNALIYLVPIKISKIHPKINENHKRKVLTRN